MDGGPTNKLILRWTILICLNIIASGVAMCHPKTRTYVIDTSEMGKLKLYIQDTTVYKFEACSP